MSAEGRKRTFVQSGHPNFENMAASAASDNTAGVTDKSGEEHEKSDPVDELKDKVEFSSSPESLTHLNDVLVLETAQQPQLTECRVSYVLVV